MDYLCEIFYEKRISKVNNNIYFVWINVSFMNDFFNKNEKQYDFAGRFVAFGPNRF